MDTLREMLPCFGSVGFLGLMLALVAALHRRDARKRTEQAERWAKTHGLRFEPPLPGKSATWGTAHGVHDGVPFEVEFEEEKVRGFLDKKPSTDSGPPMTVYRVRYDLGFDPPVDFFLEALQDTTQWEEDRSDGKPHVRTFSTQDAELDRAYTGWVDTRRATGRARRPGDVIRGDAAAHVRALLVRPEARAALLELAAGRQQWGLSMSEDVPGYASVWISEQYAFAAKLGTTRPLDPETVALLVRLARSLRG